MAEFPEPTTDSLKRNLLIACVVIEKFARQAGINLETATVELNVGDAEVSLPIAQKVSQWRAMTK